MTPEGEVVIADNYFKKTRANLLLKGSGSFLFMSKDKTPYQVVGSLRYETSGKMYDFMKSWNPTKHPGHAAAVLVPEKVYSGADLLYERSSK